MHEATAVVERLDTLFKHFEEISIKYNVEKIKTIGDCYMATAGLNIGPLHDDALVTAIIAALEMCQITSEVAPGWSARAGVYIGPLVSGVVGDLRYQFDIWGNTVNVAARLCGVSAPNTLAIVQGDFEYIQQQHAKHVDLHRVSAIPLGTKNLKGLDEVDIIQLSLPIDIGG